ncbi:MAG: hypothetical protein OEN00_04540 [Gemmatimonadota bacterium]|nr:hypothetical protein [Gemmatimonadota bacterium]
MSRLVLVGLLCVALTGLSACQTGPDGPGTVSGRVTGPADLAAAVLDVVWAGVQGFEGQGSTQVYSAEVAGEPDRYRVILVGPAGGDLTFGIVVDDVYLEGPIVTVVNAAGSDNLPRSAGDLRVLLER